MKTELDRLQTDFAWSHHICLKLVYKVWNFLQLMYEMKKTVDAFDKFRIVQLPWYCFGYCRESAIIIFLEYLFETMILIIVWKSIMIMVSIFKSM